MKTRFYPLRFSAIVSGVLALVATPLLMAPAHAQVRSTHRPDVAAFDHRAPAAAKSERAAARERGKSHLAGQLPYAVVDFDPLLDAPQFIRASDGFLTGPGGQGRGVTALKAQAIPANDPLLPIKAFLNEHYELFGFGAEMLDGARVKRDYVDKHNGLHTVVWEQQLDGIPLFQSVLMGHITRQGELTSLSTSFVPDLAASADSGTPGRASLQVAPPVSPAQAILLAGQNVGAAIAAADIVPAGKTAGDYSLYKTPGQASLRPVWFPLHRSALRLAWEVSVTDPATHEAFLLVVDAQTGQVHLRQNMTCHISDASYNVYDANSPSPFAPSLQTPGTFQPPITNRNLIVTPALDTTASPDGWIPDGSNTTTGNNIDAFVDRNFDGQPDQPRPQGNPNRVFDFPQDLTQDPKSYIDASTVQLFWRANWYHDRLYQLGFTEAAGNYQDNNFGRGGLGNDHIICYVQAGADVGWTDNSMFGVAPDGQCGQCYMFVSTSSPGRDGSLDEEIVVHELTHGTSWRLVGGGMVLGSLQGNSMGEGWSDFYATTLLNPPGADPDAVYSSAGYFAWDILGSGFNQNYYYGIRRYPYSTDMTKNPLTFKDIDPGQADNCSSGAPYSPIFFLNPCSPADADEVHNAGEVWCVTLWEMHAKLVAKHGWAVGNELTLQLTTDGMKLTPGAPNFLQARDAIILADKINNQGANVGEIWRAFAKRGMGFSARSPAGTTASGVVEAFDLPGLFVARVVVSGGNGNGVVDNNECNDLQIFLGNNAGFQVTGVSGRLTCSTPGVIVVQPLATYPTIPDGATNANINPFRISTAPSLVCGLPLECTLVVKSDQTVSTNHFQILTGTPGTPVRFDNSTPVPIPDQGETNSIIVVSNINSALSKVTAALFITHTYDSDLLIQLISPDGTTTTLSANNGSYGDNYGLACSPDSQRTTFDDDALQSIGVGSPPFVGSFQPQTPLSVFIGKAGSSVNGNWRLRVADQYGLDVGTIQCWSLFLSAAECKDGGGECPGADLALGMTAQPEPVLVGNLLTYTISVTNNGPSSAQHVLITHLLPNGAVFVSASSSQGSCSQAGGIVTGNLGTISYGGRATMTVVVLPAITGTVSSTASVSSDQSDPDPSNNSATVISHISPVTVDLAVGIAALPNPVVIGGTLTYTVSVTNNGPSAGSGISVTNVLPGSVAVLSAVATQGSITSGGGLWSVGTLASGAHVTATITVTPTATGTITATATAAGNQFDPLVANNVAAVSTVVGPSADLAVGITDFPDPAVVLSNVIYVISVTNFGPSAATSVNLGGSLPAGVNVLSTNASQGLVSISGTVLTWYLGTMNGGAKATLTIVVSTTASGTLTTSATIAGSEPDPNPANNSATTTTQVAPAGVAIAAAGATLTAESFSPPNGAIDVGETVSVILRLRNVSNVSTLNLVGTLLATNGVVPVSSTNQTYGVLAPSGFPVGRSFTFTASGTNGQTISPTLQLHDGATVYPPVSFNFTLPSAQTFANTNAITIPDPAAPNPPYPSQAGPGKPYPSVITVSDLNGVLGRVTVTLSNLSHTYPGDINVLLVGPNGAKTLLMSRAGTVGVTGLDLTFDDSAPGPLPPAGELSSGVWQPTAYGSAPSFPTNAPAGPYSAALSSFNAISPNGTWSLYVFDDAGGDDGNLFGGWSLTLSMITPVNQLADLGLSVTDAPDPVFAGAALTYTFTAANSGPNAATSVAFTNAVPAGVTLVSATPSQGIAITNANTVFANLGTLNTGAVATVTILVIPTTSALPPGTNTAIVTNTANVGCSETDPNPANNLASAVTTIVRPVADVGVSQGAAPDPVVVGNNLTNTIVVTNLGPSTAVGVLLTDPLPAGAAFVSASSTVGTCSNSGGTVTCALGDLAPNASATITLVLTPSLLGLMTNTASVATGSLDTNSANNTAIYVATVASPAPRIISVGALLTYESGPVNALVDPGETVTLSLALANVGSLDAVNLKAALQTSGGVTSPSGPQNYGPLIQGGPSAARSFTFTAASAPGAVVATLQLQDERPSGTNSLGTVAFTFNPPSTSVWSNVNPVMISDHGVATPYPSTITVSGLASMVVTKATVRLNGLTHSFPHDVNVMLVSPAGGKVLLMSHTGGGHSVTNLTLTFDDAVTNSLPNSDRLVSGTNRPSSYPGTVVFPTPAPAGSYASILAAVAGRDPNGTWSLYVLDDAVGDAGFIAGGWTLGLTTASTLSPLADLAVAMTSSPGSLFVSTLLTNTIWVTNLGPASATGVAVTNKLSSGQQVVTNLGSLTAGATVKLTIVIAPAVAGNIISTASVGANEVDLNLANNSAQTTTAVLPPTPAVLTGSIVNGQFRLSVTAQPGLAYAILASTNLASWVSLSTNTASPGGTIKFTDTNSPNFKRRFYRTQRLLP